MRKFYEITEAIQDEHGYTIHLDGKPVKTLQKTTLTVSQKALAEAIAQEWREQSVFVVPATMPLTQLASTALDRIAPNLEGAIAATLDYIKTDLVCYRAEEGDEFITVQSALFDPLLEWFEDRTGHALIVARGLMPVGQPAKAIHAVEGILSGKSPELLTAIQVGAALASSLVIALALCEGEISGAQAYEISNSEEIYQLDKCGDDDEARERLDGIKAEFLALERFVGLLIT